MVGCEIRIPMNSVSLNACRFQSFAFFISDLAVALVELPYIPLGYHQIPLQAIVGLRINPL